MSSENDKRLVLHVEASRNAAIDMTKLLRLLVVFLLFRIDWRKLIVACSVFMTVSVLIQISKLPYPLIGNDYPPNSAISLYNPMNTSVNLDKSRSLAVDDVQLKSVQDQVLLNSSTKLDRSLIMHSKKPRASQQRKKSNSVNLFRISPPSLPRTVEKLPSQLEVILLLLVIVIVQLVYVIFPK